jgi:hypothetical protein
MIVGDLKCWIEILKNNDNEKGKHLPFDNYLDGSKRNSVDWFLHSSERDSGIQLFFKAKNKWYSTLLL